ncbi:MAG: hypothetical protein BroJett003_26940 [Planctomycetota bacterium]|nr:MAG: hypothetical protein BroJett003_26940 [Planctomycetota bacterium]
MWPTGRCNPGSANRYAGSVMMNPPSNNPLMKTVRLSDAEIEALLDRLDQQAGSAGIAGRQATRYKYRLEACVIRIRQPGDVESKPFVAPTRNLSGKGIAFLHGGYVHVGTRVEVQLVNLRGGRQDVSGRVVRCDYLTRGLHHVGVLFDSEIAPEDFCNDAGLEHLRVLLVEDDEVMKKLVMILLDQLRVTADHAPTGTEALKLAAAGAYDVILMDMELPDMDGFTATRTLREQGFPGRIIAATALDSAVDQQRCLDAGCDGHLAKPYAREKLARALSDRRRRPLVSRLQGDPAFTAVIDAFVGEMPSRIADLEAAMTARQLDRVARVARSLKGEGGSCGFPTIGAAAAALEAALQSSDDEDVARVMLNQLLELCRLVRSAPSAESTPGGNATGPDIN